METHGTGRSFLRLPATLNRNTPHDPEKINLLISTEKIAGLVLLRIDKIEAKETVQTSDASASGAASLNGCR